MEDIKWMTDQAILEKIGSRIREWRLEMDVTQKSLAVKSGLSLPTLQNLEKGKSISLENLLRVLRMLDRLDTLESFTAEKEISPVEIQELLNGMKTRKRASRNNDNGNAEGTPLW